MSLAHEVLKEDRGALAGALRTALAQAGQLAEAAASGPGVDWKEETTDITPDFLQLAYIGVARRAVRVTELLTDALIALSMGEH